jgi:hypothetical protein
VREQRVNFKTRNDLLGFRPLFDDSNGIHHRFRTEICDDLQQTIRPSGVDFKVSRDLIEQAIRFIGLAAESQRDPGIVPFLEMPKESMPQHAVAAKNQDAHGSLRSASSVIHWFSRASSIRRSKWASKYRRAFAPMAARSECGIFCISSTACASASASSAGTAKPASAS